MKRYILRYSLFSILNLLTCNNYSRAQIKQDSVILVASGNYAGVFASMLDAGGHLIIGGDFTKSAYIGDKSQTMTGTHDYDAFVAKTDKAGKLIWKNVFGGTGATWVTNVIGDADGNTIVNGYFNGSFIVNGVHFDSLSLYNSFIAKLDNLGKVIWAKCFDAENKNITNSMCSSASGNIYTILNMMNSITIGNQTFDNNSSGSGSMLLKMDKNGNVLWGRPFVTVNGYLMSVAVDRVNHIYIGGGYNNSDIKWGVDNIPGPSDNSKIGLFIAKVNGSDGKMVWMRKGIVTVQNVASVSNIAVGGDGSIYAAGTFADSLHMQGIEIGTVPHQYPGTSDIIVMNLDSSGKVLWHQYFGSKYAQYVCGFCVDHTDNVYVGGVYNNPVLLGSLNLFKTIGRDSYVLQFSKAGDYLAGMSTQALTSNSQNQFNSFSIDEANKLYISGNLGGKIEVGDDTITSSGSNTAFIWAMHASFTGIMAENIVDGVNGILKISPNPVNDQCINIGMNPYISGIVKLQCFDQSGRIVISITLNNGAFAGNNIKLNIPELKPGIYFISLKSGESRFSGKFVKE